MERTPVYGIPYPGPTDKPKDASTHFAGIANGVEAALQTAVIPPVVAASIYVAPSDAARDAFWGKPTTPADQLTLQNRGATTIRSDKGYTEQYFAAYNASTNPGGAGAAGWYVVATPRTPFAEAAGYSGSGANTVDIAFPAGRFTVPPIVTVLPYAPAIGMVVTISNKTKDGFRVVFSGSSGYVNGQVFDWTARQMTPTAAAG